MQDIIEHRNQNGFTATLPDGGNPGTYGSTLWETIGNTPLIRLRNIMKGCAPDVDIVAKAEWFNPGGSVKDRPALNIILEAERQGALSNGRVLLDASSGNTALAYAMIGAARGHNVKLCVPANVHPELIRTMEAYGADVILTNAAESSDGAIMKARELYDLEPDRYFYADQYNNPANWQAHYHTTAPEIWRQTGGDITHFVAGLGTSGTFMGTGRRFRQLNSNIKLISVQPDSPLHGLEGLKHMESAMVPGIYDEYLADENLFVSTEEAQDMVKRLAKEEGLLVGMSSGASVAVCLKLAQEIKSGLIVTVFPDHGRRYIHDKFWETR